MKATSGSSVPVTAIIATVLLSIVTGVAFAATPATTLTFVVVAIAVVVLSLTRPKLIFTLVYPALILVGQVPIVIEETSFSLERVLLAASGLGIAGGLLVTRRFKVRALPASVLVPLVIWFALTLASLLAHPSDQGLTSTLGYIQKIALMYLVFIVLEEQEDFSTVIKVFLLASFVASVVTVVAYVSQGNSLSYIRESTYATGETFGESFFRGLARAGSGNLMALWVVLLFLWKAKTADRRALWSLLALWFAAISLFALRRETLLTIPLGLLFILVYRPIGRHFQAVVMAGALIVVLVAVVVSSSEWSDRLTNETVEGFRTGRDPRTALLVHFTPTAVRASPVLGYGPGNYASAQFQFPETVFPEMLEEGGSPPHNSWSAAAVEAGVGAFLALSLFLYGMGRRLFRNARGLSNDLALLWSFAPLMFLQLLVSMFFGDALAVSVTWFWFGFLLALDRTVRTANGSL